MNYTMRMNPALSQKIGTFLRKNPLTGTAQPSQRSFRGIDPNKGAMIHFEGRGNSSGGTRMSAFFDGEIKGYHI